MKTTRPNSVRAKLAIVFLYIMIASNVLYMLALGGQIYLIRTYLDPLHFDFEQFVFIAIMITFAKLFFYIMFLLSGIFFILWMVRAYRNLQITLPNLKFKHKPWVAAIVWFVPVWNLFGPYQIASNMFDKAERYLISEDRIDLRPNYDIAKGAWWALWIFSILVIGMSQRYESRNPLILIGPIAEMIGFVLSIFCAIFAIKMIRNYRELEKLLDQVSPQSSKIQFGKGDLLDAGI